MQIGIQTEARIENVKIAWWIRGLPHFIIYQYQIGDTSYERGQVLSEKQFQRLKNAHTVRIVYLTDDPYISRVIEDKEPLP